jgi:hypothetical protein
VNWWLIALAFALGLVLTGVFMVRRVTREVPVYESKGAARARLAGEKAKTAAPEVEAPTAAGSFRGTANFVAAAVIPPGPHGPGSSTPAADGSGPAGWNVKGNEDSMLYHSKESPSYGITRAEVWFRDVETAEAAGFNRWDSGKSQRGLK